MTSLIPKLESFKISNDNLVDITDEFFSITSKIEYSKIVKSNNFTLLHGTHALELLNPRLDTYLLEKTEYDIDAKLDLKQATSIISNQLKSLTCWLGQNISLPNSLLSCEYISQILEHYTRFGKVNNFPSLGNDEFKAVVFKFSFLVIAAAKFILELSLKSQIYEDEDINTTTMNLDWFFALTSNDIFKITMVSNKTWTSLEGQINKDDEDEVKYFNFIKDSFQILQTLLSLDSVLQWKIPLFNVNPSSKDFYTKYTNKLTQLENILEKLDQIDLIDMDSLTPPTGCFNLNSQIKFDNQSPPKHLKIVESSWNDCILNLAQLFNDLSDILKILKSQNIIEFVEWLKYLENKRNNSDLNEINGLHIIARILFFALINQNNDPNDPNSPNLVFNISGLTYKELLWTYLKELALDNSKLDQEMKTGRNVDVLEQVDYYLDTVSLFWKESLFLPTLNPSRQRQFKCKELKYWNMRQSETGSLEEYFFSLNFYRSNVKFYPLTFVVIYFKLKSIQEVILKSIELNLFKDVREYLSVYYQLTLISFQLNQQIDNLMLMDASANEKGLVYLNYLKNENNMIYQLSIFKSKAFEILSYLGYNKLPKNIIKSLLINEELLFKLQWKQLNDIKDPEMLKFDDLQSRLSEIKLEISAKFTSYEALNQQEMNEAINDFNQSVSICNSLMNDQLGWFEEMKSIKQLQFESLQSELLKSKSDIMKLVDLIKTSDDATKTAEKYSLKIVQLGRHSCFPGVRVTPRE